MEIGRTARPTASKVVAPTAPATDAMGRSAEPPSETRLPVKSLLETPVHPAAAADPSDRPPVQRLRAKTGLSEADYKNRLRATVILYAELGGEPVGANGVYTSNGSGHAEENLINDLPDEGGVLEIWLSTSPCSHDFGTRTDGKPGCQERLEALRDRFKVTVHADHLYQPKEIGAMERDHGYPTGFSSASSALASAVEIDVSRQPRFLEGALAVSNDNVAQLALACPLLKNQA